MSTAAVNSGLWPTCRDLVALTKPRVTSLVLATAVAGMLFARGELTARRVLYMLLGTWMCVAAANALNCFLERETDKRMPRTRSRPLPAGRLDPNVARAFGLLLGVLSLPVLALGANLVTAALGLIALGSYVGVYTPMKTQSPAALIVGAVPGALPPLMGYAAITGEIGARGVLLFALLFLWQLPHVIGLGAFRRDEYVMAGIRVLPAVCGAAQTRRHALGWVVVLVLTSLLPTWMGWAGRPYLLMAAALGGVFLWAVLHRVDGTKASTLEVWGKRVFLVSLAYLPLLFTSLLLDGRA
jgi:protoheme IX farnesyltransferase